jgi:predicted amidophosphoribosyltransferase
VRTCSHCGQPLPADANFCAFCGNAVAAEVLAGAPEFEDTIVRRWSAGEES